MLVYNKARAHEGLGHLAEAIELYEKYLAEEPSSRDRGAIEQRLVALRQQRDERGAVEKERSVVEKERAAVEKERAAQACDDGSASGASASSQRRALRGDGRRRRWAHQRYGLRADGAVPEG